MEYNYPKFTPEMKKTHTILIPNMAITQFRLLEYALRYDGYKCEILGNCGSAVAQLGLKYVHNATCYQALLDKYHLRADECIFIDDRADNLVAASALGFGIYEMHNVGTLLRSLPTFGVSLH